MHPGESLLDVLDHIQLYTAEVASNFRDHGPFGVGLRISDEASKELMDPLKLQMLSRVLQNNHLYAFSINGFPAGRFSGPGVKENVYIPDWTDPDRLEYSKRLGRILAALIPDDAGFGSISTLPGGFKPWIVEESRVQLIARNMLDCAIDYDRIFVETGKEIVLSIEPEPYCFLETVDEVLTFFRRDLFSKASVRYVQEQTGKTSMEAKALIRKHLGLCFDTCHSAIEFEQPEEALSAICENQIRIGKIQLSSALELNPYRFILTDQQSLIDEFRDEVYLHQVVENRGNHLVRYRDLDEAIDSWKDRMARKDSNYVENQTNSPGDSETVWRVHYHLPLFFSGQNNLRTTGPLVDRTIRWMVQSYSSRSDFPFPHFEVETYTWNVLPDHLKSPTIQHDIVRELKTALGPFYENPAGEAD